MLSSRFAAQLLTLPPALADPLAVTKHLLAVQAQDPRGARLSIRVRSSGPTAADVDRALTQERSLVVGWLNRGTLHLVASEDYRWLHALIAPGLLTGNARRLGQEGVTPAAAERGVAAIEKALFEEGPLTRAQLGERIAAAGVRTTGQALVHILLLASLRGLILRGPMVGREHAYVLVGEWLGKARPVEHDRALAELARRYLTGHGPADERDLAKWAGLPLRNARAGLGAIAAELREHAGGRVDLAKRRAPVGPPPPRLLGPFDPLLLGWSSREWILGDRRPDRPMVTSNGIFRAIALVDGRAAAIWKLTGGRVELTPFGRLARNDAAALRAEALDVERFMSDGPPDG
jgi:hypothetical protein